MESSHAEQPPEGLLDREAILERILSPDREQIFRRDSFDVRCLRSAAYDLRIAGNGLTKPDGGGCVLPDQTPQEDLKLKPGDVVWVSTYERFCMPWDLAGNISPKFRFARKGLLIFTGMLVDPGFGLERQQTPTGTDWLPATDTRLYFPITNISSELITLELGPNGSKLLSIQLFGVQEPPQDKREEVPAPHPNLEHQSTAPLTFFRDARATEQRNDERLEALDKRCTDLDIGLRATRESTDHLIVFGFIVLGITLIGVTFSITVQASVDTALHSIAETADHLDTSGAVATVAGAAILVALVIAVTRVVIAWVHSRAPNRHGDAERRGVRRDPREI